MPTKSGLAPSAPSRASRRSASPRRRGRGIGVLLAAAATLGAWGVAPHGPSQAGDAAAAHDVPGLDGTGHLTGASTSRDTTTRDTATRDTTGPGAARPHRDTPRHVVPAREVPALTAPAIGVSCASAPAPQSLLSPAATARLTEQTRASRAAARAMNGARLGYSRPVEGTHFTSGYKQRWGRLHAGLDFAGPVGQVVRAVAPGTVTVAGPASGYGRLIEIRHPDGRFTRYGHLHRVDVEVGQRVGVAEPIGALGNAGRSTGPHLHFEVRTPAGTPVDPMPWLRERGIVPIENPAKK